MNVHDKLVEVRYGNPLLVLGMSLLEIMPFLMLGG